MSDPNLPDSSNTKKKFDLRILSEKIGREFQRFLYRRLGFFFGGPPPPRRIAPPRIKKRSKKWMKARYNRSASRHLADNFVLYRIIGNDLFPRHVKGQSYTNVKFILEHEPALPDCEKRWIVNRIADGVEEARIIELLDLHKQPYVRIPFEEIEYSKTEWDSTGSPTIDFYFSKALSKLTAETKLRFEMQLRQQKILYVMNNNGARNAALLDGRDRAKWILPFDGNCFFTAEGFEEVRQRIISAPWYPYVIVPMARILDNSALKESGFAPPANEEPQIVFRNDAGEVFNEKMFYGRRPKVELLWRLVVPGIWDRFRFESWETGRPPPCPEAGLFQTAGFVARLDSGRADLEIGHSSFVDRGKARSRAIIETLDELDGRMLQASIDPDKLTFYSSDKITSFADNDPQLALELKQLADIALTQGPYTVVDKTTLPPSGDIHDYWHPAPYWWPDESRSDGLPYIWKDGQRIAGTSLYDIDSGRYDRTRLQNMFDNTIALALAGTVFNQEEYSLHAANNVRTWFLDPTTRMNPHLDYAQVRLGHNNNVGAGVGIIEFKDMYFFLDGVRLLMRKNVLSASEIADFKSWLAEYAHWLENNAAGRSECSRVNNHGTFYDVQIGAIAAFLGDAKLAVSVVNRAKLRLSSQFGLDGSQPHELERTMPRHYTAFGLIGWTTLARLLQTFGYDLWNMTGNEGRCLAKGFESFAETHHTGVWPRADISKFSTERLEPLWVDCRLHFPKIDRVPHKPEKLSPIFHPDFGIAPFWVLTRP